MKRFGSAVLVVALCAVAAVLWWRFGIKYGQPADASESIRASPAVVGSGELLVEPRNTEPPRAQDTVPTLERADYAAQFRRATDLLEFARSLLGAARAGDHAAQYYIFRALEYCADEQLLYFRRRGVNQSLDDALKFAATIGWPFDPEVVRRAWIRCHTTFESGTSELGERRDWLRLASDGGYPLAQVIAARYLLRDSTGTNNDNDAKLEQRRNLVAKAIRSRDPEVIWQIANTPLGVLDPEGEIDYEYMAWSLAACQRGFDCSPQSEAVRWACLWDRACQPYESMYDIFRRARGDDYPEIEARARWINEKIDAGDWETLGF